ncbi:MAG: serine/threonine protein kinase, AGC [Vezdaea aestivalis]|nr:MAG: serine/threonine protein kinase, AGC [Vezdaea aestivalis]
MAADDARRQSEKAFIAQVSQDHQPLSPEQITDYAHTKKLGQSSRQLRIDDFELIKTLGTGTFARVWLVRLRDTNTAGRDQVFALKILRKVDVIRLKQVNHVRSERTTLAAIAGHPFITTLITSFSDHDSLYMLLNYCPGGEVFTQLRKNKRFDIKTATFYAAEILLIIEYLHDYQGVAYRDLKPENLLIDAEGHIKLVDFGFAKKIGNRETYTLCGTPEYLAPEVIQSKGHTMAVDWWAFGVLLYEFICGYPPFWDQNPMKIYEKIVKDPIQFPKGMPPAAQDLITGLCNRNLTKRLGNVSGGSQKLKSHPFFNGINWDMIYNRKIQGPIIPQLSSAADTSHFDEYEPESEAREQYTDELQKHYEEDFADF